MACEQVMHCLSGTTPDSCSVRYEMIWCADPVVLIGGPCRVAVLEPDFLVVV